MIFAASTNRGRASSIGMRKPAYSDTRRAAPEGRTEQTGPPDITSRSAICSATRIGSCHGSTMTAVLRA